MNPHTTTSERVQWEKDKTDKILSFTGNRVSYICHSNSNSEPFCPSGTLNLKTLEQDRCGSTPCDQRNESNCLDCDVCTWVEDDLENGITAHCSAQCPLPPKTKDGWGKGSQNLQTDPPIIAPTPAQH